MKLSLPPKTLQMVIINQWLVDSITSLGSGYLIHLTYPNDVIDPEVLLDIRNQCLENRVLGEIIFLGADVNQRIAEVEVAEANDFKTFIRFDLRLLEVTPFIRNRLSDQQSAYQCSYVKAPS